MAENTFGIFPQRSASISGLIGIVDSYPQETHNLASSKTSYPVEDGASVTDNVVHEPDIITLEGYISNIMEIEEGENDIAPEARPTDGWARIRELKDRGEPLRVVTLLGAYENMIITRVDSTVDQTTGTALRFSITLEEMRSVSTRSVKLPPIKVATAKKSKGAATNRTSQVNGGQRQGKETGKKETSLLKDLIGRASKYRGGK